MLTSRFRDERGVSVVLFALLLPVILALSAIVLSVGNWYTHARHLQTKVDAGALAGGSAWQFPCGDPTTGVSASIIQQARTYVGPHIMADGNPSPYNASAYNPQVGNPAPASKIHVVLNGSYWTDSSSPPDLSDPSLASTSLCQSMNLDVKATEDNTGLIGSIFSFFPDIKRSARVQIQQVEGLNGLLPIAVRVPQPQSAAAVFYNEGNGTVLAAKYFCKTTRPNDTPPNWVPTGLNGWTTYQASNWDPDDPNCSSLPTVALQPTTGVAIVTSFTPACGTGTPAAAPPKCLSLSGFGTVNDLCRQGNGNVAQCYYTDPATLGSTQNVTSGLQFIRSYSTGTVTDGAPELRSAWMVPSSCTGSAPFNGYFASIPSGTCSAAFNANVDIGTAVGRSAANTDVKYGLIYGDTTVQGNTCLDGQNRPNCDMTVSGGGTPVGASATVNFNALSYRNSLVIRVRLKNTKIGPAGPGQVDCGNNYSATCQWFFTTGSVGTANWPNTAATLTNAFNNPVQRVFMGDLGSSGSVKFLSLSADTGGGASCDGASEWIDTQAASVESGAGHNCFYLNMGLAGGLAKAQSDPPIQLNIGVTSQSSVLDCDPNFPNLKDEVQKGCQTPFYAPNSFTEPGGELCPGTPYGSESVGQFFNTPKASPFDDWPPFTCVLTQTAASPNQIMQGFNQRLFGVNNNPTCPADDASKWVKGRDYWSNANNLNDDYTFGSKNGFNKADPRLVDLFFTPYNSFTGNGNEEYPVVGFGSFYITGYGTVTGGNTLKIEDPCLGNTPPADMILSNGGVVWGHFVKQIAASANSTPSGVQCKEFDFLPCIPVLVR